MTHTILSWCTCSAYFATWLITIPRTFVSVSTVSKKTACCPNTLSSLFLMSHLHSSSMNQWLPSTRPRRAPLIRIKASNSSSSSCCFQLRSTSKTTATVSIAAAAVCVRSQWLILATRNVGYLPRVASKIMMLRKSRNLGIDSLLWKPNASLLTKYLYASKLMTLTALLGKGSLRYRSKVPLISIHKESRKWHQRLLKQIKAIEPITATTVD